MTSSVFDSVATLARNWSLVGRFPGDSDIRRIIIPSSGATVGRSSGDADIVLPSTFVSSRHSRLVPSGIGLEISDLGSRNGTFLCGERIVDTRVAEPGDTVAFADVEFQLQSQASEGETGQAKNCTAIIGADSFAESWTLSNFTRLVEDRLVTVVMQPVVELRARRVIGLESLARSEVSGLETPAQMFEAAEMLDQAAALSELCREKAIEAARGAFKGQRLFLNTHPHESLARDVVRSVHEIRRRIPSLRLVIEVHEDLIDELAATRSFTSKLAQMGVEFALDNFGGGRSRINEVLRLRPNFVKFDQSLIRDIDQTEPAEQETIKSLVRMLKSLSIRCVAKGIERSEEADVCSRLGFELAQGFLFARPARIEQLCLTERSFSGVAAAKHQGAQTREYDVLPDDE